MNQEKQNNIYLVLMIDTLGKKNDILEETWQ